MTIKENGHRFLEYKKWETLLHQPYDYANNGIMDKIISHKIVETTNPVLKYVLKIFEYSVTYMLKSVDYVKHYKNYNWKNR